MVYIAEEQMESISLHYWLDAEATMYEQSYQRFGDQGQLPNPYQFDIFWSDKGLPAWLSSYTTPGFYEHQLGPEDKHFRVGLAPNGKGLYYLVFKDDADDFLDDYESVLHTVSFTLSVFISIGISILMYYLYRQFSTPLKRVLEKVPLIAPDQSAFEVDAHYKELADIEQALLEGKRQINQYLMREQDFTRFAAHEIRTPLMTLQGSAELLEEMSSLSPQVEKAIKRIKVASMDIDQLIKTFLLLGQDELASSHYDSIALNEVLHYQLKALEQITFSQEIALKTAMLDEFRISVPQSFAQVLCKNLLKNALSYAHTYVEITLKDARLNVRNDVAPSAGPKKDSYGYGLIIIQRICEKLNWSYTINETKDCFEVEITLGTPAHILASR
jgi:signal transduction histidine kinase